MSIRKNLIIFFSETIIGVYMKSLRRRDLPDLSYDEFKCLKNLPFFVADDGKVYVDISRGANKIFVYYFLAMAAASTTSLINALKEADLLYPEVTKPEDILNCEGLEKQKEAAFKIIIPYELERRKRELEHYNNK